MRLESIACAIIVEDLDAHSIHTQCNAVVLHILFSKLQYCSVIMDCSEELVNRAFTLHAHPHA